MDVKITLFVGLRLMRTQMPSPVALRGRLMEPLTISKDWLKQNKQMAELKTFFAVKGYAFNPKTKLDENPEVYVGFPLASCETHYANCKSVAIRNIKKYTKLFKKAFDEEPQILFGFTLD